MGQNDIPDASPEHNVTLTSGFYLGKYEVTQAQYEAVMTGNTDGLNATPSNWPNNPNRPVEMISWEDVQVFLTRLNAQQSGSIPDGWAYILPTEAQWEYACRAGTTTAYSWGDDINSSYANYAYNGTGTGLQQTSNAGNFGANPWGFFDMHGNVHEWTADWYAAYNPDHSFDPEGPSSGSVRVVRGASWWNEGNVLLSSSRHNGHNLTYGYSNTGFRLSFQYTNKAPTDLNSTTTLTIAANQPIGTVVGELNATDPEGGAITYSLVSCDNNNSLFTLESNGTLKTATTFDYETNASTYTITVKAMDEHNATVEGNFTVTLTNVFEDLDGDGAEDFYDDDIDGDGFSNATELAYGSDPRDANSVAIAPPADLNSTAPLTVPENQPIGTIVGEFNAIDPDDANQTGTYRYELVSGEGAESNARFTLTEGGVLKTATLFDYEIDPMTFSIRVRTSDEFNASMESSFLIFLLDETTLVVDTMLPEKAVDGGVIVGVRVLNDAKVYELGVLLAGRPISNPNQDGVVRVPVLTAGQGSLSSQVYLPGFMQGVYEQWFLPDPEWSTLYAVAYGINVEGETYGLEEVFDLDKKASRYDPLTGAQAMDNAPGWWESPWLGNYYRSESGWMLHLDLGWLYPSPSAGGGLWMWKEAVGWIWTEDGLYPYLYSAGRENWLYFFGEHEKSRLLYDYGERNWMNLNERSVDEKEEAR